MSIRSAIATGAAAAIWCVAGTALAGEARAEGDQAVSWIESYDEAIAEARETGKPIFLEFRCAP